MKMCFHSQFYANFHESVTAIFDWIFVNFHQNVVLHFGENSRKSKGITNDILHFGKFLLFFELGRGRYSAPNQA